MDTHINPGRNVAELIAPISRQIWDAKYRLKAADGRPLDLTIEDTWLRVARALAAAEPDPGAWVPRFYDALTDFRFLPAGRIIAGAGTERRVTLFNCFVMGRIEDDLGGIFAHLREAALTMQQGGGIGYDFSTLRPKGAPVRGVGADASGPLSFMDVWDAMCRTIMSAGSRRGAMMATLRCDHPDIEAFIAAKREPGRLRNFNLSVLVTDPFMAAVEADADWPLVFGGQTFRVVKARALWDGITRATYDYAEPGRAVHRPHQRPQQPQLLRDDPLYQSLRRAAAAAVWRLPAGLDQSRRPDPPSLRGRRRPRHGRAARACPRSRCECSTTRSMRRAFPWRRSARRRGPSAGSGSASPALPTR